MFTSLNSQKSGMRYCKPVVLAINAKAMQEQGYSFFQSQNGDWLTDHVLPEYIRFE